MREVLRRVALLSLAVAAPAAAPAAAQPVAAVVGAPPAGWRADTSAAAQTKLLRFPDIHGDKVVFTYAGDLWTAPVTGGTAVRLT
ncbi:MAG TPA: hypothetical protein VMT21_06490, partial [Gemmatimonadales bacterium]|nr:hypothetical protein [Gemmatimonadales bacterium]